MITLTGNQTVNDIRKAITFPRTNCIVKLHLESGQQCEWPLEDARACYVVYRMNISEISNAIIVDLYNY